MKEYKIKKKDMNNKNTNNLNFDNVQRKRPTVNLDNNISYSQSDESKSQSESEEEQNNDNSYDDESDQNEESESDSSGKLNKRVNMNNIRINNYNNKPYNNNNGISLYRGISDQKEKIKNNSRKNFGLSGDKKLTGYSDFFNNYKRAFSGGKNYKPHYLFYPTTDKRINTDNNNNIKFNDLNKNNNQILQSNYAPTHSNTKVTKIKKAPLDEITNNIRKNLNQDFYSFNNNYNMANNIYMNNPNLNKTSPNIPIGKYIVNVKKLPYKGDERFINNNFNGPANVRLVPINENNEINKNPELPGGNKTMGYYSRINMDNQQDMQNLIMSNNYNLKRIENNDNERNKDERYLNNRNDNERFMKMNYATLSSSNPNSQMKNQPLNFAQVIKQSQANIPNSNGRITIVKKLPPLSNNNNNKNDEIDQVKQKNRQLGGQAINNQINPVANNLKNDNDEKNNKPKISVQKIDNNGLPILNDRNYQTGVYPNANNLSKNLLENSNNSVAPNASFNQRLNPNANIQKLNPQEKQDQTMDAANVNKNYIPQSQASNTLFNQNKQQQLLKAGYMNHFQNNVNTFRDTLANEENNENENNQENEEKEENKNITNIPNSEDTKKNVDISYNDFDGSGWIKNYGGVSRPGKDINGNQKTNQDTLVSLTNINNIKDFNIFGVLDGHGPQGHFVSQFASEYIPSQIINHPAIKSITEPEQIYEKLKENNCEILTNACLSCDETLKTAEFDAYNSGTTCNLIIHIGAHIICVNTGDSRSIVAYDDQKDDNELNYLESAQLSMDYKPDIPEEKNRILMSGGMIHKIKNEFGVEVGPYRVWIRGTNYPGLAMSRSIGDLKGKAIGVIPDPGIMEYDLCESTRYIIIGSDGVWEFLHNDIVKDIGKKYYLEDNASEFCHQVVKNALTQWEKNENFVDDITAIVIFF